MIEAFEDERYLAGLLRVSLATVRRWRLLRQGPKYIKIGAAVRYRPQDIADWLSSRPSGGQTQVGAAYTDSDSNFTGIPIDSGGSAEKREHANKTWKTWSACKGPGPLRHSITRQKAKHPGRRKPNRGVNSASPMPCGRAGTPLLYSPVKGCDIQCGENSALNGGEVIGTQAGSNVLAVEFHAVKTVKGDTRDHVAFRPGILHGIEERIATSRDQMMESLYGIRHDGTERDHQTESGMVAAARGHDNHVTALYHLRRLKTCGEVANQHRSGVWVKGDGHQPFRFFAFGLVARAADAAALAFFARAARCAAVILAAAVFPPVLPPSFPPLEPCFRKNSRTSGGSFFLAIDSILHRVLELNRGFPFT